MMPFAKITRRLPRLLRKGRAVIIALLAAAIFLFVQGRWLRELPFMERMEGRMIDLRFDLRGRAGPHPGVAIVGVTNVALKPSDFRPEDLAASEALRLMTERAFPWNRKVWALLLDRLVEAGARVIALDFVFASEMDGDPEFAAAIARHRDRVVLGWTALEQTAEDGMRQLTFLHPHPNLLPSDATDLSGFVFHHPDSDGVLRRVDHRTSELREIDKDPAGSDAIGFPALAVKKAVGREPPPGFGQLINYQGGARTYPHLAIHEVFIDSMLHRSRQFEFGSVFRDKIVFVGPIADILHDTLNTPFNTMPGVEVHAQVAADLLTGRPLRDSTPAANWWLTLACVAAPALTSILVINALRQLALLAAFGATFLAMSYLAFVHANLVIPMASPLLGLAATGAFGIVLHYVVEQLERARIRAVLDKYVSKNVASVVMENSDSFEEALRGQTKCVTVLFSDIRGFTTISETQDPKVLVPQLNEYFLPMVDAVLREGGTLQKFIGDAIMAVWGDTHSLGREADAIRALRAALQMRAALARLNQEWSGNPLRLPLASGIGINHGEVIVGEIGHPQRMEFTVLGDGVNLAARLESATKQFHCDILVGENAEQLTRAEFVYRQVDRLRFKGKNRPIEVFLPLSDCETPAPPWLASYHEAIRLYRARAFREAAQKFEELNHEIGTDDFLCGMYAARCQQFQQSAPPADWDGSHTLTDK